MRSVSFPRFTPERLLVIGRHPLILLLAVVPPAAFPSQIWLGWIVQPVLLGWYAYAVAIEPPRTPRGPRPIVVNPSGVLAEESLAYHHGHAASYLTARHERQVAEALWAAGDGAPSDTLVRLRGEDLMVEIDAEEHAWHDLWAVHQPPRWERLLWLALGTAGAVAGGSALLEFLAFNGPFIATGEVDAMRAVLVGVGVMVLAGALRRLRPTAPPP